ncbi:MAG: hypothetical protein IPM71_00365 [Bacteroidota bacterium]|nr:MAG: hypothetical protein IPM71_00365 [Bacteroidota bacterium]
MKRIILIVLVLGVLGALITYAFVFRKSATNVNSAKAELEISSDSLLFYFEQDEVRANTLYLDKVIKVSGTIAEISSTETGVSIYLKNPDTMSGVLCGFSETPHGLEALKVGDMVSIKGICRGYLMDVNLNKCSLAR